MNILLEKIPAIQYYTNMADIFDVLGWAVCQEHDWLINDLEIYGDLYHLLDDPIWIKGTQLTDLLFKHPDEQFIWAAFSAFAPDTPITSEVLPVAQSPHFWRGLPLKPQHPQAQFEIICWDSSLIMLIGLPDAMAYKITAHYPEYQILP